MNIRKTSKKGPSVSNRILNAVLDMRQDVDLLKTGIGKLETKVGRIETDVSFVKSELIGVNAKLSAHDKAFERVEMRFDRVEKALDLMGMEIGKVSRTLQSHESRIAARGTSGAG